MQQVGRGVGVDGDRARDARALLLRRTQVRARFDLLDRQILPRGERERGNRLHMLPAQVQGRTAGDHHRYLRAPGHNRSHLGGDREEVVDGVEQEQETLLCQVVSQRVP